MTLPAKTRMLVSAAALAIGWSSTAPASSDYIVIDLSGGPAAAAYPVGFLSAVPEDGWTEEHKTTKLVLRRIPAGAFTMGSPTNELGRESDETRHQVAIGKDFYVGVFEVTQKQWERVMGNWPGYFTNAACRDSRPVEQVSYYEIRENPTNSAINPNWPQSSQVHPESFMGRLRARTGLTTLDLPTESQWEYACRAGTTTALNSGKDLTTTSNCPNMSEVGRYYYNHVGGYSENAGVGTEGGTAAAGAYLPNQWGLYDMHGNVWEWCLDWSGTYPGDTTDPAGATSGTARAKRGGSWYSRGGAYCRSANRNPGYTPAHRSFYFGFRVAGALQWPGAWPVPGDYDGDGCGDLAMFDWNTGLWYIVSLSSKFKVQGSRLNTEIPTQTLNCSAAAESPTTDHRPPITDLSGVALNKVEEAKPDHHTLNTEHCTLNTGAPRVLAWAEPWGWTGAWPVPGDYDGDGLSDLAVFDQNTGFWFVIALDRRVLAWAFNWGWPGAIPVPGDYDGDGASDFAMFDWNTGLWYIVSLSSKFKVQGSRLNSETPTQTLNFELETLNYSAAADSPITENQSPTTGAPRVLAWAEPWGWAGAGPVPGDYDGDGRSDLAVFDCNTGAWYIRALAGEILLWAKTWGWPGAIPVPGDYDGDGRDDLAMFDSNSGNWFILNADGNTALVWGMAWGWPGAVPAPGDYDGDGLSDLAVMDSGTGFWYITRLDGVVLGWAAP